MVDVIDLIDLAASDPAFLLELRNDPLGAAAGAGFDVSSEHVRELLAMPAASQGQLTEVLQARLSYASKSDPHPRNFSDNTSACAGCAQPQ